MRGDCAGGPRPCPWVGCRHHLFLTVDARTGHVHLAFPGAGLGDMVETCSLDVADRGGASLEVVGVALGLTRERVRQIEEGGLARLGRLRHLLRGDDL